MRILFLFFVVVFCGCKTTERQRRQANYFFDNHPGELAAKCASRFPVIDSMGVVTIEPISSNHNADYQPQIDSLVAIGENALVQLIYAKRRADSISEQCADVVLSYMWDIERLQQEAKRLQKSYRPCYSDTIQKVQTIYRRSLARETSLKDSLDQALYQLGQMTDLSNHQIKELSDKDDVISRLNKEKGQWMWKAIGTWIGLALIMGGGLYYLIKR